MAGRIFIEAHYVGGLPAGAQHLYLVYRDHTSGGEEFVIRAGAEDPAEPFGGPMEIEINVPIGESADDRGDETPAERHSTPLDFPGGADVAWSKMVQYARELDAGDITYNLFRENSNAFIGAMLHAAGGRPGAMLPNGIDVAEAIGFRYWRDIVSDFAVPGDALFRGTAGSDRIVGLQMDESFALYAGADTLFAGRGDDTVQGGAGRDRLVGQEGADVLSGGSAQDLLVGGQGGDTLIGGAGGDRLIGGAGGDLLVGGSGADRFEFVEASGRDLVDDFEVGVDQLYFRLPGVSTVDDLVMRDAGDDLRIDYAGGSILVAGVNADDLTSRDLVIVAQESLVA